MKIPRIAIFLPTLIGGGTEKVFLVLSDHLLKRGFKVDFLLCQPKGDFLEKLNKKIRIVDLNVKRMRWALFPLIKYYFEFKPDVILTGLLEPNILAVLLKKITFGKVRVVTSVHSVFSWEAKEDNYGRLLKWVYGAALNSSDVVVAVSKGVSEDLARSLSVKLEKIKIINNPIPIRKIRKMSLSRNFEPWYVKNNEKIVLAVGRLTSAKNHASLIRAFSKIANRTKANLLILGEGEERKKLETLIRKLRLKKRVLMPGFVHNPFKYMREAEVFVLCSRYEGFANVLVEAMVSGAEVISTNCDYGPSEILEGGEYGELIAVDDDDQLASAILRMRKHLKNGKKTKYLNRYDEKNICGIYISILGKLAGGTWRSENFLMQ